MRVVNLSRKPFLNRRPVSRIAVLLWILGGVLLVANTWLYAQYLSGTTKNRELLAEIDAEIDAEEAALEDAVERVRRLDLRERNQKSQFLNELIAQRTFPWSRLFDDLEDALPDDVYLESVAPKVRDSEPEPVARRRKLITPREARERRLRQQRGGTERGPEGSDPTDSPSDSASDSASDTDSETGVRFEVIELSLVGRARTDDALLDFVDQLYAGERFVDPFLSREEREKDRKEVRFNISTYYLLSRSWTPATDDPASGTAIATDMGAGAEGQSRNDEPLVVVDPSGAAIRRTAGDRATPGRGAQGAGASARGAQEPAGDRRAANRDGNLGATPQATQDQRAEAQRDARGADPLRGRGVAGVGAPAGAGAEGVDPSTEPATDAAPDGSAADTPAGSPAEGEATNPELIQPDASASPRLRRVGWLRLSEPWPGQAWPGRPTRDVHSREVLS